MPLPIRNLPVYGCYFPLVPKLYLETGVCAQFRCASPAEQWSCPDNCVPKWSLGTRGICFEDPIPLAVIYRARRPTHTCGDRRLPAEASIAIAVGVGGIRLAG